MFRQFVVILIIIILNIFSIINTQHLPLCESLNDIEGNENDEHHSEIKLRRIRALCDAIYSSQGVSDHDELDLIPDFDLTQMTSGEDVLEKLLVEIRFSLLWFRQ